ncbi:peptide chain release factor N(5)-glutamine methyltransferase [Sandaracinus amylolyticus]|uniref:peptide chain release factor N(5)-glutamine methyltransferase n=1 Tax=Sandaracinus amylolyticus TaxID=927083 RepID=UPI001F00456A|nr:peptide chain release factor N(5)-glutamine methyltransferase [Sandaracinus amylolyticus]UJR81157.1 Release factor glutamine methyltransferase [Sandaracinus amylolyticus]
MQQAERWTIRRVVKWSADDFASRGIESSRLDAELLVAHALGLDRVKLYMDLDRPLAPDELTKIRELVLRRRKREPVAYILGRREFFGRSFEVSPAVLIPRPDTETLIEAALERLPEDTTGAVLDLCTGSGAIAVTLAAERPGIAVDATDLSEAALEVAKKNAETLGVSARVRFHHGDLFAALPGPREYALIACNPPYIAESERAGLAPDVVQHEPGMALFSGSEGLDVLRRLCAEAPKWLAPGASILIEVGAGQAPAVIALLERAGLVEGRAHQDLGGHERVVEAKRA